MISYNQLEKKENSKDVKHWAYWLFIIIIIILCLLGIVTGQYFPEIALYSNYFIGILLLIIIFGLSYFLWYRNILLPYKPNYSFINMGVKSIYDYNKDIYHPISFFTNIYNKRLLPLILFTLIILILIDSFDNLSLSGWISGLGSLSAAILALYSILKLRRPRIKNKGFYNPVTKHYDIQLYNESKTPTFVRLTNITVSDGFNPQGIYLNNCYHYKLFKSLKPYGTLVFHILGDNSELRKYLEKKSIKDTELIKSKLLIDFVDSQHDFISCGLNISKLLNRNILGKHKYIYFKN